MKDNNAIIQKIRKLLALADGASNNNEHEREVARQFAMDLLGRHNLSLAQVEGQSLNISVCTVEGSFRLERWVEHVLDAVCELYYTDYYISVRKTPMFVGTAENIAVAIDVAAWLIESIRKESNRLYKDSYERRSLRTGAGWAILMRAIDMVFEEKYSKTSATPGTSLTVVRNQLESANEEYMSHLNLRQTRRRTVYIDRDSFDNGSSYGAGVSLGKQKKRLPQFA